MKAVNSLAGINPSTEYYWRRIPNGQADYDAPPFSTTIFHHFIRMIHMIRLDHPQYFLCKFADDTVRAGMPSLGAPTGAPSSYSVPRSLQPRLQHSVISTFPGKNADRALIFFE
jgi:hypothetical protein